MFLLNTPKFFEITQILYKVFNIKTKLIIFIY